MRLPFSTLREQGSSKLFFTLGQAAWVFQVLVKAAAVPSTTPLRVRKSSAWLLLKFPQRPGDTGVSMRPRGSEGGHGRAGWAAPLTAGQPPELGHQPQEHLHGGYQLHSQLQAQVGLGNDEEGGWSEDCDVAYGHRCQRSQWM